MNFTDRHTRRFTRFVNLEVAAFRDRLGWTYKTAGMHFGVSLDRYRQLYYYATSSQTRFSRPSPTHILIKRVYDVAWLRYCEREGIDAAQYINRDSWDDVLKSRRGVVSPGS